MANNRHIPEESPNTISVNHTNSGLSRRSIAQRARRERERQLREHALFNQDLPNHPFESVARNLNDVLNRKATQTEPANPHTHNNVTKTEILPPFALGGITMNTPNLMNHVRNNNLELSNRSIAQRARRERKRQLRELASIEAPVPEDAESFVQNEVPIPINPTIVLASNFPSSTFEIGESSSVPANVDNDEVEHVNVNQVAVQLGCHFLGQMDVVCMHCSALHWRDEQLTNSSSSNPRFGQCCLQGKIKLPKLDPLPSELQELYNGNGPHSRSFRKFMREYNASNAFTSLGVHMDDRVVHVRGPSSFVIYGELHHRIGSLIPNHEQDASYAQLYIYNLGAALDTRYKRNPRLNRYVLQVIQDTLVRNNPFCELYRHAYEVLEDAADGDEEFNVPGYLHYSVSTDHRRYNMPTTDEIAVILPGDGSQISGVRVIIVYRKANQGLMRIIVSHMIFQTKLPPDYETSRTANINIQATGYQSFLIVSDPSIAKHIFRENSKAYSKGILAEILEFVMGKGLIPADGEIWRVRRRPIIPALHKKSC
ncbi:hypothetical protein GIB67_037212 [Kingdonia uniflora]|uniref:Helitron helicase-like domain-containing protein n=1 Tax=Kingdonia uniflora TaxID=39325 RepID=A0A7J7MRR8_9MAGN|nr:hypothetical protein GIB67_037212 [Kingdonia uniflora]